MYWASTAGVLEAKLLRPLMWYFGDSNCFCHRVAPGFDVERGDDLCAGGGIGRSEKELVVPNHGRAVADAGERLLPEKVGWFPVGGNADCRRFGRRRWGRGSGPSWRRDVLANATRRS